MDLALETGRAANATHRITLGSGTFVSWFLVQERRKFLWVVPYWHTLSKHISRETADAWLRENWKLPAYFQIVRKDKA